VESVSRAVEDAVLNAKENGVSNVKFQCGEVENIINDLGKFDKVIVDPPRAGLIRKRFRDYRYGAPVIYICVNVIPQPWRGCGDIKTIRISTRASVAVDMFPHTYHIEAVTKLVRE
jgi:23S rRNA (uracil1939-C5)-methyltransferase